MTVTRRPLGGKSTPRVVRRLAVLGGGVALAAGWLPSAAAFGTPRAAVTCAQVLFVGARGTGEKGPGSPNWMPSKSDPYGLGGPVNALRRALLTDIAGHRTMQTVSVRYNTNWVGTLLTDPKRYFADLKAGVNWTTSHLATWSAACPAQRIVLAGYSQGAMVMHRVMHLLAAKVLSRVAVAVLIADGDQLPADNVTRYGSASLAAIGAGQYPAFSALSGSSQVKFSASTGSKVLSVCNAGDIVCDTSAGDINAGGVATHLFYSWPVSGSPTRPVRQAALAAFLRTVIWGTAIEVPGTAALSKGNGASVDSVSCASAGNCVTGGSYSDGVGGQAFVASEVNGTWHAAIEVAGNVNVGDASVLSLSCASAGNCAAGGYDSYGAGHEQAFVASEVNGTWHAAIEVEPDADVGDAQVDSVSCGSAGNCAAGGSYTDGAGHQQAFVASEVKGTWHAAVEVAGALNKGGSASVSSVSCASPGNCAVGGYYTDRAGLPQAFVASEVNGTWHTAIEVPGTANTVGDTQVSSVTCASVGNCAAGGSYRQRAFVASEVNGTWQAAIEVEPDANAGIAGIDSVSCASAGNCAAGGSYTDSFGNQQAFVASEVNGTWQAAAEVPGTAALNTGGVAAIYSVSCASAGNCAAGGGAYAPGPVDGLAFVASEVNGTWHTAIEVPGTAALNTGDFAQASSVSCASAGYCVAGGYYLDSASRGQAFVTTP